MLLSWNMPWLNNNDLNDQKTACSFCLSGYLSNRHKESDDSLKHYPIDDLRNLHIIIIDILPLAHLHRTSLLCQGNIHPIPSLREIIS